MRENTDASAIASVFVAPLLFPADGAACVGPQSRADGFAPTQPRGAGEETSGAPFVAAHALATQRSPSAWKGTTAGRCLWLFGCVRLF